MVGDGHPVVKGFMRRKPTNMMTSVDGIRRVSSYVSRW